MHSRVHWRKWRAVKYRCIQNAGDLVSMPVGWFHGVVALEPSILVESWLNGNGYEMLSALYVYMRTSRIRHKGKNERGFMRWTDKESIHFESGMSVLLGDLKSLIETKIVSQEKVVDAFKKIWCFIEFNKEETPEGMVWRRKWFLNVVWSKDWQVVATEL